MKFFDWKRDFDECVYDPNGRCVALKEKYTLTIVGYTTTWTRRKVVERTTEVHVERLGEVFRVRLEGKYPGAYDINSNYDFPDLWRDLKSHYPIPEDELHAMAMEAVEKYLVLVEGRESA